MEDDILLQVQNRIKSLLFDETIMNYRKQESFMSRSNRNYNFLIWKLQPENWEQFSLEVQQLIEKNGYQAIPGACDVTNYDPEKKTGYKVMAFYMPS